MMIDADDIPEAEVLSARASQRRRAVHEVCDELAAEGIKPSLRMVRAKGMGRITGSDGDVQEDVRAWYAKVFLAYSRRMAIEGIPPAAAAQFRQVFDLCNDLAAARYDRERLEHSRTLDAANEMIDALRERQNVLEGSLREAERRRTAAETDATITRELLATSKLENHELLVQLNREKDARRVEVQSVRAEGEAKCDRLAQQYEGMRVMYAEAKELERSATEAKTRTEAELAAERVKLEAAQRDLATERVKLEAAHRDMSAARAANDTLQLDLSAERASIVTMQAKIMAVQDRIADALSENSTLQRAAQQAAEERDRVRNELVQARQDGDASRQAVILALAALGNVRNDLECLRRDEGRG